MSEGRVSRLSEGQTASIARMVQEAMAGATSTARSTYGLSHDRGKTLGVIRAHGLPYPDTQAALSVGLSDYTWADSNFPDRLEILHIWDGQSTDNEKLVITAAETMIMRGKPAKPGAIYLGAVKAANLPVASRMPHALLTFPYMRGWGLEKAVVGDTNVWLLQVTPIFEQERQFIEQNGFARFEELLSYDVMDLHRMNRASHVR
jgi:hypothetical protein